ncbi:MAG: hypothetical protein IKU51_06310 [Clostridia bacterium]|nr:hypothetical protein [Clostridia bacterium]
MMEMWKGLRERLKRLTAWRSLRLWLWIGLAGMLLIALSEWLPRERTPAQQPSATVTAEQVEAALEQRIGDLLCAVEGVGDCRVMVTLESDTRSVYAADTVTGADTAGESYLTVATDEGPVGLLLTRIQPTVKGVAVVCRGGDDPAVCERVTQVVTTAFHISERRVCVVKQN